MTDLEFKKQQSEARKHKLSRFAEFMFETNGYSFFTNKLTPLDKWEVFHVFCKDPDHILMGRDKRIKFKYNK